MLKRYLHTTCLFELLVAALLPGLGPQALPAAEVIDFQRDIRPIFAEHCLQCHGPDEAAREADLRLDRVSSEQAHFITPGQPQESELYLRVTSADPDTVMPPPDQDNPLSKEEVMAIQRWIAAGAEFQVHWAFDPPVKKPLPARAAAEVQEPIDRFVASKLEKSGLSFSPRAAPEVLARRIYLDLIGLPPTPSEVDQFVSAVAASPANAIDELIDDLLSREQFGEKWARHWLDVARYADSNGYEKDLPREQWAWRDWVIDAINRDMPYDRFVVEQLAGDLLPNRTQNQLVATGFLRNGMINEEGAIVPEQFRMDGIIDRIDCIGKAVLGLSIQCAQCHSHKFDPISQDEYYGMFAFLNDTYEAQSWVYTETQQSKIAKIEREILSAEQQLREQHPNWSDSIRAWEAEQKDLAPRWDVVDTTETVWIGGLNHPDELADHSVIVLGHPSASGEMYLIAEPQLDGVTGLRLEALVHDDLPFGGPGRSTRGSFAVSELRVEIRQPGDESWESIALATATADFSEQEQVLEGEPAVKQEAETERSRGRGRESNSRGRESKQKQVDTRRRVGPATFLVDGDDKTAWRSDRGPGIRNTDSVAVIQFAEPVTSPPGSQLKVSLVFQHTPRGGGRQNSQLGRMRLALTSSADPITPSYDFAAMRAMQKPKEMRNAADRAALFRAWRRSRGFAGAVNERIAQLEMDYPEAPTSVLTMTARTPEHHRPTFLLDRGLWDSPQQEVLPHVPAVLHSLPERAAPREDAGAPTRLDFARWLVDRRSPLTARVQVNRTWQAVFGRGLVETPEDFGTRVPRPEHLAVLDWLAIEFMENGWSTKWLIKEILGSRTYQQSAHATPALLAVDSQNRLLARGPRFRADAEVIRDIALSVSGLLSQQVGGPSVFPPVPQSVLDYNYVKPDYWEAPSGSDRYRRALYVFRKRSMPDPVLTTFDAPNADVACARRVRSNTPLASLVTLNEPIFVEAARSLALRVLREGGETDEQRSDYIFRLCTGRRSTPEERRALAKLLTTRRKRLAEGWLSINEVATGDPAKSPLLPPDVTPQDVAAWTIVARVVLNLDETLSKN